jgi:hypothetical protein
MAVGCTAHTLLHTASACCTPHTTAVLQSEEMSELLDFAEQERLTLQEKEAVLQRELSAVRDTRGRG